MLVIDDVAQETQLDDRIAYVSRHFVQLMTQAMSAGSARSAIALLMRNGILRGHRHFSYPAHRGMAREALNGSSLCSCGARAAIRDWMSLPRDKAEIAAYV
jgi:hypothetical protein